MSQKKKYNQPAGNYGIQANSVIGEVMATGTNASASKTVFGTEDRKQLQDAVQQLRDSLGRLDLAAPAKAILKEDTDALAEAVTEKQLEPAKVGGLLKGLSDKLRMAGIVVSDVVALSEPVRQLASLLKIPMHMLGF